MQQYKQEDMDGAIKKVNDFLKKNNVFINEHEFDAVVCLVFNYPSALSESTDLGRALMSSTYSRDDLVVAFTYTKRTNPETKEKKRVDGLVTRRINEINLFLNGDYETYYDSKQKILDGDMEWIEYP